MGAGEGTCASTITAGDAEEEAEEEEEAKDTGAAGGQFP